MKNLTKTFEQKLKDRIEESQRTKERVATNQQAIISKFEEYKEKHELSSQELEKAINLIQEVISQQKEISSGKIKIIEQLINSGQEKELEIEQYLREFQEEIKDLLITQEAERLAWEEQKRLEIEKHKKNFWIGVSVTGIVSIILTSIAWYFLLRK